MNLSLPTISITLLLVICVQSGIGSPLNHDHTQIESSYDYRPYSYRASESQQVDEVQKPISQEPIKQEPIKQEPVKESPPTKSPTKRPQEPLPAKQETQEPTKQQEPVKQQVQEPVNQAPTSMKEPGTVTETHEDERNQITETTCTTCEGKAKPDYSKAIAIAVKGNAIAAGATAAVAAPVLIKSAKIAALAGLIPIKLAAKGAIIGTLIAKPIIIKSALVGATAAKLSHLFVGKPIAIGANLLAGAEALKAKLRAKKTKCVSSTCSTVTSSSSGSVEANAVAAA